MAPASANASASGGVRLGAVAGAARLAAPEYGTTASFKSGASKSGALTICQIACL
jgi:hypothetical protein